MIYPNILFESYFHYYIMLMSLTLIEIKVYSKHY